MSNFILDCMLSPLLEEFLPGKSTKTVLEYGLNKNADDSEVVALSFEHKATLVSADVGMITHSRVYQGSSHICIFGLLLLPDGDEIQKLLLRDINSRKKKLLFTQPLRKDDPQVRWKDVTKT